MYAKRIETYGDLRPLTNGERMATWAAKYFSGDFHLHPERRQDADSAMPLDRTVRDCGRTAT